jgi:two-component system chemotaxis response regulator CheY
MLLDTSFSKMTVLIVMNDGPLFDSLKTMIRAFGVHSLLTAPGVEAGLSTLRDKPVAMVFTDYGLAPINGLEFARRIRHGEGATDPATSIIMLASAHERALMEAAPDIGVNGFIDKALSPSSVYSCMLNVALKPCDLIRTENFIGLDRRENPRGVIGLRKGSNTGNGDQVVVDWAKVKAAMAATPRIPETPFIKSAHNDIQTIIRALDEATRDPAQRRPALRSIGFLAGSIMEQGMAANYPLMSSIAESLLNTCRKAAQTDADDLDLVKSHINAMAALIFDETNGHGHAMDGAILDLLCGSARQQNVHPQPVIWPRANV